MTSSRVLLSQQLSAAIRAQATRRLGGGARCLGADLEGGSGIPLLAGGVVGACTGPLKNLQTRVIAQKGGRTAAEVASTAVHNRALRDSILSAGLKMPIIMTALNRGIQFYTFETVKAWLLRANQKHPKTFQLPESVPPSSVAGGAAGLAATLLLYPFSAVGDHMSLQPGKYPGLRQALVGVAQQHGASQLFRGVVPKLASMVPASAINFLVFESLKEEIKLASMVPASAINFLVFESLKEEVKARCMAYMLPYAHTHTHTRSRGAEAGLHAINLLVFESLKGEIKVGQVHTYMCVLFAPHTHTPALSPSPGAQAGLHGARLCL
ncbi:unnamed protein product [Closterium sp. Naga37s-1]|nr:unnamed protein product [Closterium sp. Naga37s-1]